MNGLMKKSLVSLSVVGLLASNVLAQTEDMGLPGTIEIKTGWQNIATLQPIDVAKFNDTCVDYIWRYDDKSPYTEWKLYIANKNLTPTSMYPVVHTLNPLEGFWVMGNGECTITLDNQMQDAQ